MLAPTEPAHADAALVVPPQRAARRLEAQKAEAAVIEAAFLQELEREEGKKSGRKSKSKKYKGVVPSDYSALKKCIIKVRARYS